MHLPSAQAPPIAVVASVEVAAASQLVVGTFTTTETGTTTYVIAHQIAPTDREAGHHRVVGKEMCGKTESWTEETVMIGDLSHENMIPILALQARQSQDYGH